VLILLGKRFPAFQGNRVKAIHEHWFSFAILILFIIILLALIAVSIHGEMGGANNRFSSF